MKASDFGSVEELVGAVEACVDAEDFDGALRCISGVEETFPDDALAHHAAGLVHERRFFLRKARGGHPTLEWCERAAECYRRARRLDPSAALHAERLYAVLFVLGTQTQGAKGLPYLLEAHDLAVCLVEEAESASTRNQWRIEVAVVSTAIARLGEDREPWVTADRLFEACEEPEGGREAFFFHFYRGLARRNVLSFEAGKKGSGIDPARVRVAVRSLSFAIEEAKSTALAFLLADSLLMLDDLDESERARLEELMEYIEREASNDALIRTIKKRYQARRQLLDGAAGDEPKDRRPS